MKKIIFLISAVLYSLASMGQQVALNDGVSIDIPIGAQKITKEEAIAHAGKKFNNDKEAVRDVTAIRTKHIYKVDDILISLNVFEQTAKIKDTYCRITRKESMQSVKEEMQVITHQVLKKLTIILFSSQTISREV